MYLIFQNELGPLNSGFTAWTCVCVTFGMCLESLAAVTCTIHPVTWPQLWKKIHSWNWKLETLKKPKQIQRNKSEDRHKSTNNLNSFVVYSATWKNRILPLTNNLFFSMSNSIFKANIYARTPHPIILNTFMAETIELLCVYKKRSIKNRLYWFQKFIYYWENIIWFPYLWPKGSSCTRKQHCTGKNKDGNWGYNSKIDTHTYTVMNK